MKIKRRFFHMRQSLKRWGAMWARRVYLTKRWRLWKKLDKKAWRKK